MTSAAQFRVEGYQYVALRVLTDLGGGGDHLYPRLPLHPAEPSGKEWDEDKVADVYPRLAVKYEYPA